MVSQLLIVTLNSYLYHIKMHLKNFNFFRSNISNSFLSVTMLDESSRHMVSCHIVIFFAAKHLRKQVSSLILCAGAQFTTNINLGIMKQLYPNSSSPRSTKTSLYSTLVLFFTKQNQNVLVLALVWGTVDQF